MFFPECKKLKPQKFGGNSFFSVFEKVCRGTGSNQVIEKYNFHFCVTVVTEKFDEVVAARATFYGDKLGWKDIEKAEGLRNWLRILVHLDSW